MNKKRISSDKAPKAIGPYSQAIEANGFLFCSGQVPIDPSSGNVIKGDIVEQTHQVMRNLNEVLSSANCSFENVVKTTIYCTDLSQFKLINETYGSYFKNDPPARATVQVAALPLNVNVEIEMIAIK